jgi:D-3-phosphoglycerate dehydrogenase
MVRRAVLITDDVHPMLLEGLQELGWVCTYLPHITHAEVLACIADYEGLVINSKIRIDKELLDRAVGLEFVARLGSGLEIIDLPYAALQGVQVFSSPEGNRNAVAEHALGMLLCLYNKLHLADAQVREFVWAREANRGTEIDGKTVGIVGYGHTGGAFARKLRGFDVTVLVYDKYRTDLHLYEPYIVPSTLGRIAAEADIISFHVPLAADTKYMVNRAFLSSLERTPIIINTSRGNVVHTADLLEALCSGVVGGACLDVFEHEKPELLTLEQRTFYEHLFKLPNVVVSPHIAGWTHESKRRMAEVLLGKITAYYTAH